MTTSAVDIGTGSTITFGTSSWAPHILSGKWSGVKRTAIPTSYMGQAAPSGTLANATFISGILCDPGELDIEAHLASNGANVYNGQGASVTFPSGYAAKVLSGSWEGIKRPAIETTHIGTAAAGAGKVGNRTFIPGRITDPGEITLNLFFDTNTRPPVEEAAGSYVITLPNTSSFTVTGFATDFDMDDPLDAAMTSTIKIKPADTITVATAPLFPIDAVAETITVTWPLVAGGMTSATLAGSGFMTEVGFKFGMDEAMTVSAKCKWSGNLTITAAT